MDVSPKQIVSVSTALIPFVEHDDANRALMGANMQKQAVPLVVPEAPYIGTGVEARAARDAGDVLLAEGNGTVTEVTGDTDHRRVRRRGRRTASARRSGARSTACPSSAAPTRTPASTTHAGRRGPERGGRRRAGRRPVDPQRRAGAGQEPARRLHALGGLQLRGRHHPLRAPGARRRADLDPHRGARGRRPRHQAGRRGDHPGHPQPVRGDPGRPRRARHHPHRRRGGAGRRAGRQGHPQGRDRADARGAPAAGHLRREGPRGARHLAQGAPRRVRQGHRRPGLLPRGVPRAAAGRQPAGPGLRGPEAQDLRGRQAGRPPRQQGRHLQDPPGRGHAVPGRRHPGRHHPQPARRAEPDERGPGARVAPRLRRPLGLGGRGGQRRRGHERQGRRRGAQDPAAHRAGGLGLHPGLRRRPLGRGRGRRGAPDDPADLRHAERRLGQRRRADPRPTARPRSTTAAPARPTTTRSRSATSTS